MHPVKKFIENDLKTTTNAFSKQIGVTQSVFSSWYTRNTSVDRLPIWVINSLATTMPMNDVYDTLKKYEKNPSK